MDARAQQQRRFLFHVFVLLLGAFLMGLPTALASPDDRARWMTAHVANVLGGAIGMGVALAWGHVRLGERAARTAMGMWLAGLYAGFTVNVLDGILDLPGPASSPSIHPTGAQLAIMVPLLVTATVGLLGGAVMTVLGLRGKSG